MLDEVTAIEKIDCDADIEDFCVNPMFNDKRFVVGLSREHTPCYDEIITIKGKKSDEVQTVRDDDNKGRALTNKISQRIEALVLPFIEDHAPPGGGEKLNLYIDLNPETITFQVATMKGKATLVQRTEVLRTQALHRL